MRVSLDVESVLVDTHGKMIAVHNERHGTDYTLEDADSWDWVDEAVGYERFMDIVQTEWEERPLEYAPVEAGLSSTVDDLTSLCEVDIVTARTGVEEEMQRWLDHHGITGYNEFKSVEPTTTKAKLDYNYYIDDKPKLADRLSDDQHQFILDQPWNRDAHDHPNATPVASVAEAVDILAEQSVV